MRESSCTLDLNHEHHCYSQTPCDSTCNCSPFLSLLHSQQVSKIKLLFTLLCASNFRSIRSTPSHTDHCLRESEQLTYWSPQIRVIRTQHPSSFLTDI